MQFWNFIHDTIGLHVYVLLMFILAAAMIIIAIVHHCNRKNRDKNNEEALEELKNGFSAEPEKIAQTAEEVSKI